MPRHVQRIGEVRERLEKVGGGVGERCESVEGLVWGLWQETERGGEQWEDFVDGVGGEGRRKRTEEGRGERGEIPGLVVEMRG